MKVKEVLANKKRSGTPLGVLEDATLADAVKTMVENDTGSCLVTDKQGKLRGLVTFREVIRCLHNKTATCQTTPISEVMIDNPDLATPEDTIDQIRKLMTTKHIRYLPVMTDGILTDVISFYDVARAVAKDADFENRMLKSYINDWPDDN